MIACVTGGTGFIGSSLVAALRAERMQVRVLSRRSLNMPEVEPFCGDLLANPSILADFVRGADVVYHCAGEVKDESRMRPLHIDGTAALLDAVCSCINETGRPVRWVQLSSVGAYGPLRQYRNVEHWVTEESPEEPIGEYEVTKTLSDRLVAHRVRTEPRLTAVILRPSNVFGPRMSNQSVRSLMRMVERGYFFYIGRHDSVATYIHVEDVVRALLACGSDPRAGGRIYNLSNDCTLSSMIDALAEAMGVRRPMRHMPEAPLRLLVKAAGKLVRLPLTDERIDALTRRIHYPAARLQAELGFVPTVPVPQGMADFYSAERTGRNR